MTITQPVKATETARKKASLDASQLMKEFISDRNCQNLMRFFVAHPNGRFSKLAIVHGIDDCGSRLGVERVLSQLVKEGVLLASVENKTAYYMLTRDEPTRQLVLNLAGFDWHQWRKPDHYYVADRRLPA